MHLELNYVLNQHYHSRFMSNMLRLVATIEKCPDFFAEMSGILDTRIPTFCNSVDILLDDTYWCNFSMIQQKSWLIQQS